jgi:hypothetical protein
MDEGMARSICKRKLTQEIGIQFWQLQWLVFLGQQIE